MPVIPVLVLDLLSDIHVLGSALKEIEDEWGPDPAPLTISMGDVGRTFARSSTTLSVDDVALVFRRVERLLVEGTEVEKDAVATGFLEAVAAVLDDSPGSAWILQYAGPRATGYLSDWDRFSGVR